MESVAEFHVDLAGVVVMEAAEGDAVVYKQAAIGDVQRVRGDGEAFAETFAQREIERGMPRQIEIRHRRSAGRAEIAIGEARAIVNICRRE